MRWVLVAVALALAGCSSAGQKAEREYEIVAKSGTDQQRCTAARKVADAYLAEEKTEAYNQWNVTANIYCQSAQLRAQGY